MNFAQRTGPVHVRGGGRKESKTGGTSECLYIKRVLRLSQYFRDEGRAGAVLKLHFWEGTGLTSVFLKMHASRKAVHYFGCGLRKSVGWKIGCSHRYSLDFLAALSPDPTSEERPTKKTRPRNLAESFGPSSRIRVKTLVTWCTCYLNSTLERWLFV